MPWGSSANGWLSWLAPGLTILLGVLASLLGVEVLRVYALGRLERLRAAHWTERAQVFTDANNHARLFRIYLVTVTPLLLLFDMPGLGPQAVLRLCAGAALLVALVGDPLAGRWVRRATAGSLTPVSWLDAQAFGLMMFPARSILIVFGALAPRRYDAAGWIWASALLVTLVFAQAGGAALFCRALGVLRPADEALRQTVASAAQAAGVAVPPVYELGLARVNAFALPMLGWVAFTSGAVQRLEPRALFAIAAHELGHLRESRPIKLARVAVGGSIFLVGGLVPAFPKQPLIGLGYGCALFVVVALGMRVLSVRLERRADALAHHHEHDEGDYAAALERIYRLNWMGVGVVNRTHPSLYDRMERAGVRPSYPRPPPPARLPKLLVLAFGAVCAIALVFLANPLLASLFVGLSPAN